MKSPLSLALLAFSLTATAPALAETLPERVQSRIENLSAYAEKGVPAAKLCYNLGYLDAQLMDDFLAAKAQYVQGPFGIDSVYGRLAIAVNYAQQFGAYCSGAIVWFNIPADPSSSVSSGAAGDPIKQGDAKGVRKAIQDVIFNLKEAQKLF